MFIAHDDGRGSGEVILRHGFRFRRATGGQHLKASGAQGFHEFFPAVVAQGFHPFAGRGRGFPAQGREGGVRVVQMYACHAKGVATAVNGRHIVRIVNIVQHQRQIFLALAEHFFNPGAAAFGHAAHG